MSLSWLLYKHLCGQYRSSVCSEMLVGSLLPSGGCNMVATWHTVLSFYLCSMIIHTLYLHSSIFLKAMNPFKGWRLTLNGLTSLWITFFNHYWIPLRPLFWMLFQCSFNVFPHYLTQKIILNSFRNPSFFQEICKQIFLLFVKIGSQLH